MTPGWIIFIIALVALFLSTLIFFASRYKRCPSDAILVIYGKVGDMTAKCIHGGGALIWPLIQDCSFLSLTPMTINIPLQGALSLQNIRVHVPSTFTVGISTDPAVISNAAERLLGLRPPEIEQMAREIIFGQLRLTVASLTIEQINQDRESFLASVRRNVEPELNKIGLYLINVNITDITDVSGYIDALGKKAAAEAVNQAMIDVAEQEKLGAIGGTQARKERDIRVAENEAAGQKGMKHAEADQRIYVQQQESLAIGGENTAKGEIADFNASLAVKQAEAMQRSEVAKRIAEAEIQKAQYKAELERLNAAEVAQQEVEKRKIEIAAEAEAERIRRVAKGEADGVLLKYQAEAQGLQKLLEGKAVGYSKLVESCGGDAHAAATLLMVEKIENIVSHQVEAIKNLKIDKITVWDSGASNGTSSTANFAQNLIKSIPPLHEIAHMAGVQLPDYLGKIADSESPKPETIPPPPADA
ncbi:MAG: SPFH domain-containing protein [Kiritimatiellia bacterium]|jgi:flotillin|nr:SPFH domain-containing protein [Kiritimatiellia bacterium]